MSKLRNSIFLVSLFLLCALSAHAQTLGQTNPVQFVVDPEVPAPGAQVTITAQGVGGFLGDSTITWQKNGTTELSGVGERTFSFVVGAVGTPTRIHVNINSPSQGNYSKDFTFTPSLVHLIWEANTSVPPLFRGKALYSAGSQIKVVALPQFVVGGVSVSSNRLSFEWSVGGEPATEQSGLGRAVFTYAGNQLKQNETISVTVSYGGSPVGQADLTLPAVNPSVLFYVQDPLRGTLFDQALPGVISLAGKEVTLRAEPYYFSNETLNSALTYSWKLGGQKITGPNSDQGILTLRQEGNGVGEGYLTLDLQNTDNNQFLQAASTALHILFGQDTSVNSAFGI
jgi:hypothetical protein